jgi:stearoyl-CoA desaturase (delta-9 desaturase)
MSTTTVDSKPIKGVVQIGPAAARLQRTLALVIVALPVLGVGVAVARIFMYGVAWWEIAILVGMYVICVAGVSIGFHRHFAHRAFKAHPAIRSIVGAMGSMAAQGPLAYWIAQHRRHHVYSDQPGDPHSPHLHGDNATGMIRGFFHAHIGWLFSEETADWIHFAHDVLKDPQAFRIHRHYFFWAMVGLVLPTALGAFATGTLGGAALGFLWGGLVRIFALNHASWCVGSVCHLFGKRPFETHDHSANNVWVALFTFGEGLQNNHHAFPSSAAHAVKWYEPDFSIWIIRILKIFGLVWEVNLPSPQAIAKARKQPAT